ncbi:BRO-N domain-containing protein [Snodgrassella alvi]|uniref:BRO-N domain-containing protein n=3 Tax=Snodgrassella alvi TaxID=1196083 RepID=UPI001C557C15|nr:BRO family protein [Snodgrassella alvi]
MVISYRSSIICNRLFKTSNILIELKNNEPLFCLADVTDVLDIKNHRDLASKQLNSKGVEKIYTLTQGGKQELLFIDEANLYRVIFRSNKKEAVDFQNWVFEEVLPSIRKTGKYQLETKRNRRSLRKPSNTLLAVTRAIRSRDDLSFTMRDADGGLINWVMPDRAGNWHEHYGIGTIWFNEILELARHNAKEAYFAMRFAGSQMVRYWQQGHPEGFFDCMAQWALSGILSGSSEPHLPFSVSCPGIPPQEGMDYYLAQAAPRPSLSPEEQQRVDQQAMQEVLACQRQCYEYRRQQIMMRRT